jgi:hypothetical protein
MNLNTKLNCAESFLKSQQSLSQEIAISLWNHKVYFRVHKTPTLDRILIEINSLYFLKINFNILSSAPGLPRVSSLQVL